jgi:hypothetical protein
MSYYFASDNNVTDEIAEQLWRNVHGPVLFAAPMQKALS